MATINPPNLYSAGAVVFNTQPSTAFAIQLLQQKKAKEEALDNYYQKLPSTINEAGMRDQDREGFMQSVGELQAYWRDHRDAIKNPRLDGGAAQYNFERLFRGAKSYVEASKVAAKAKAEEARLWANPQNRYLLEDPEVLAEIDASDRPLNGGYRPLDLAKVLAGAQPFEQKDWDAYWKGLPAGAKPSEVTEYRPDPADRFSRIPVTTVSYSKDQLAQIGQNAAEAYATNRRLRTTFDKAHALTNIASLQDWREDHDAEYGRLNQTFKAVYGRDISSPAELHAAEAIGRYNDPQVKTGRPIINQAAKFEAEQAEQNARQARSLANQKNGSGSGEVTVNDVYSQIDQMATERREKALRGEHGGYLQVNLLDHDAQSVVLKMARDATGDNGLGQQDLKIVKTADNKLAVQWADSGKHIGYLTPKSVNLKVQPDVKGKRAVVAGGNPSSGTYTIKGKSYSKAQVEKAAQASGMTIDQYVQLANQ